MRICYFVQFVVVPADLVFSGTLTFSKNLTEQQISFLDNFLATNKNIEYQLEFEFCSFCSPLTYKTRELLLQRELFESGRIGGECPVSGSPYRLRDVNVPRVIYRCVYMPWPRRQRVIDVLSLGEQQQQQQRQR